jgi:Transcriptional regulator, AbiEi antitoxin
VWETVARAQAGVITRAQVLAAGLTHDMIRANVQAGRWTRLCHGVYATFTGAPSRRSLTWAALLRAGPGAVLSHQTAAELQGLVEQATDPIHVTIPESRTVVQISGVVVHRSRRLAAACHPTRMPPQTRIEETVLDLTQSARSLDEAMSWLARAVGARLTTPERLAAVLAARSRVRWRRPLVAALTDVDDGCHSLLELHYVNRVERPHGLPRGERQSPTADGPLRYRDVLYREFRTVVELNGSVAHPEYLRSRDMRRDNVEAAGGNLPLSYGWGDVEELPCDAAVQVGTVLKIGGWTGEPHPCRRPGCAVRRVG